MAKFKISLKLQGLELNVEGSRDDVPLMTEAVGQQLASLLMPASTIVEGEIVDLNKAALPPMLDQSTKKQRTRRQKTPASAKGSGNGAAMAAIVDWVHDPSKWGTPQQNWPTADKAIWLLYVVSKENATDELTGRDIGATFNKHFRQSGPIVVGNINRDLGKAKGKSPALVAEDTTQDPPTWFLTQAGTKRAEDLVAQALGRLPEGNGA